MILSYADSYWTNFFGKLKEFKRIAKRADRTDSSFTAIIHLAASVIN
jgi:transposase